MPLFDPAIFDPTVFDSAAATVTYDARTDITPKRIALTVIDSFEKEVTQQGLFDPAIFDPQIFDYFTGKAELIRRELGLSARDASTGWCSKQYNPTFIQGMIMEQGQPSPSILSQVGFYAKYPHTAYIPYPYTIEEGDELTQVLETGIKKRFLVTAIQHVTLVGKLDYYLCRLEYSRLQADRPASCAWHTDSQSAATDIRNRMKTWLDTYLTAIYKDSSATPATKIVMFAKPDYHLWREFSTVGVDAIAYIEQASGKARTTHDHYPYAFDESATIRICAIDKTNITATRLVEEFEQAIRDVATDHPVGSIRSIESIANTPEDIGGVILYSRTLTISYARANDDYTPSYPTITWGPSASPTGTFTFPNATHISPPLKADDAWLKPPGFSGSLNQALGSGPIEIEVTCDLDMEPAAKTWRRPQTTAPKTDGSNYDIFLDLIHNEGINQAYHTLTLQTNVAAASIMTFKVRLVSMAPDLSGEGNKVTLLFREYMTGTASGQTIAQRFGITV